MSDTPKEPSDPTKFGVIKWTPAKDLDRAMDRVETPSPEMAARIKNPFGIRELTDTPKELSLWNTDRFVVGTPDSSGTTVSISVASKRLGVSVSTLRRRLQRGDIPGAYKAGGPDGLEWRIPVASLDEPTPTHESSSGRPSSSGSPSESSRVRELEVALELERALRQRAESEVDSLRGLLTSALDKLPKALPETTSAVKRRFWRRRP